MKSLFRLEYITILRFLFFSLSLPLSACQSQVSKAVQATQTAQGPEPEKLSFEVLEKRETGGGAYSWLLVFTERRHIFQTGLELHIDDAILQELYQVDYQKYFSAVVFRGELETSSPGYIPEILKVTHSGDVITIHTHFPAPADVTASPSSPYTVLQVTRPEQWTSETIVTTRTDWETPEQIFFIP